MLNDLKILNGTMSLEFNPLNTIYTITIPSNENKLEIEYKADSKYEVSIFGNEPFDDLNEVVISVYNDKELTSYYLYVQKEETVSNNINSSSAALEFKNQEINPLILPSIASICFLILLLFFALLFKKSSSK